jgi:hypothetical protein
MHRTLMIGAAWAYFAFIVFTTLSSLGARTELPTSGFEDFFTVVERFGGYAILGLLFCLAYPGNLSFACILVFGSAVVLELLRDYSPDTGAAYIDFLEKLFGGAAGIFSGILFYRPFVGDRRGR